MFNKIYDNRRKGLGIILWIFWVANLFGVLVGISLGNPLVILLNLLPLIINSYSLYVNF